MATSTGASLEPFGIVTSTVSVISSPSAVVYVYVKSTVKSSVVTTGCPASSVNVTLYVALSLQLHLYLHLLI
ncbi:hypothetical protein [Arcobacter roscoffensis]|uniref:Transmembrane protein n=1 Tax=Arcobacter roscoffensis TaxID=2961520 RepID=A0ABY5E291_9BACT|nr:hypothetical protein [Arcobacter roscoffensis]UTJ06301.1 hypothetical protein NJU99_13755 [Arcobacter roscoffensis]